MQKYLAVNSVHIVNVVVPHDPHPLSSSHVNSVFALSTIQGQLEYFRLGLLAIFERFKSFGLSLKLRLRRVEGGISCRERVNCFKRIGVGFFEIIQTSKELGGRLNKICGFFWRLVGHLSTHEVRIYRFKEGIRTGGTRIEGSLSADEVRLRAGFIQSFLQFLI